MPFPSYASLLHTAQVNVFGGREAFAYTHLSGAVSSPEGVFRAPTQQQDVGVEKERSEKVATFRVPRSNLLESPVEDDQLEVTFDHPGVPAGTKYKVHDWHEDGQDMWILLLWEIPV